MPLNGRKSIRGFQPCLQHVYTVIHHVYHASEWYILAVLACQMYRIKYLTGS